MPLVFVYGPDTVQGRMYDRIGPTNCLGAATLPGYKLVFNKPNMKHPKEGLPNLMASEADSVFGLLFDLTPAQLTQLDGFFGGYGQSKLSVLVGQVEDQVRRKVTTWEARRTKNGLLPSYQNKCLSLQGMQENGAEAEASAQLASLEVADPESIMSEIIALFIRKYPEDQARERVEALGFRVRRRMRSDHEDEVMLLCQCRQTEAEKLVAELKAIPEVVEVEGNDADYAAS